uniref:Death domain-containing protein n=1 Tax=Amphimedon queenslandica TaxID=400682 RepID=A0A1X7SV82_AMPQE
MIDVSQWRASIGLWNYCQAASSRPANGCHSHSFKVAVDSKSGSTISGEKTSKLPAAMSLIAFLLLLFLSLSLLRHILMIPPKGNWYQVQCTTGVTVTDTNYLQSVVLPRGSSSNLIYNDLYLIVCLRMLLLLSGDVELNPGPMIDDRPDISLLIKWLEPLVDWKPFGLCLAGISRNDILKIEQEQVKVEDRKLALYSKWLSLNSEATWRDVIDALTSIKENKLTQDIKVALERDAFSKKSLLSPRTSSSDGDIEIILFPKEDQKVQDSLNELQIRFSHIMRKVKSAFYERAVQNSRLSFEICNWIECYLHWEHGTVD